MDIMDIGNSCLMMRSGAQLRIHHDTNLELWRMVLQNVADNVWAHTGFNIRNVINNRIIDEIYDRI